MSKIAELTINQLIKIIIGIIVFVIVVVSIYMFFNNYVIDFFKNIVGDESSISPDSAATNLNEQFETDIPPEKEVEKPSIFKRAWNWINPFSEHLILLK